MYISVHANIGYSEGEFLEMDCCTSCENDPEGEKLNLHLSNRISGMALKFPFRKRMPPLYSKEYTLASYLRFPLARNYLKDSRSQLINTNSHLLFQCNKISTQTGST